MAELGSFFLGGDGADGATPEVRVDMLDYEFVANCTDVRLMKAIVNTLQEGKEGHYPELTRRAEEKLMTLLPEKERKRIERLKSKVTVEEEMEAKENINSWLDSLPRENVDSSATQTKTKVELPPRGTKGAPKQQQQSKAIEEAMSISVERQKWMFERERAKGNEFYKCGELDSAFECYSKCLSMGDFDVRVYTNRAITAIKLNKFKLAEEDCSRALESLAILQDAEGSEAQVKAYTRRGLARFKMGKYGSAIEDFASAYDRKHTPEILKLLNSAKERFEEVEGHAYGSSRRASDLYIDVEVVQAETADLEDRVIQLGLLATSSSAGTCSISRRIGLIDEDDDEDDDDSDGTDVAGASSNRNEQGDGVAKEEATTYRRVNIICEDSSDEDEEEEEKGEDQEASERQRIDEAIRYKDEGNAKMKAENFDAAIHSYSEGVDLLMTTEGVPSTTTAESKVVLAALLNNRSAAHSSIGAVDKAFGDANAVLTCVDTENVKALYRRACALRAKGDTARSKADLQALLRLVPTNAQAKVMLDSLTAESSNGTAGDDVPPIPPPSGAVSPKEVTPGKATPSKTTNASSPSPVKPPTVPTGPPKNLYELERVTRSLRGQDALYVSYLRTFKKRTFDKVIVDATFNLDIIGVMLQAIERQLCTKEEDYAAALKLLEAIARLPKMDLALSLMAPDDKAALKRALSAIKSAFPDKEIDMFTSLS